MNLAKRKSVAEDRVFNIVIYTIAAVLIIIVLYPLIFVLSASFSDPNQIINGGLWLLPKGFTLDAYTKVFHDADIWNSYKNTVLYTTVGTIINIILTTLIAYPLSRRDLPGRNLFMIIITFTMFFQGGIIPTYLIVQNLGMVNTFWAMVIPNAIATYNVIVMRTFFQTSIPWELQEAAQIDGCTNFKLFLKVILPLSKPIIAVMVLFYAVGHWNSFFDALIYLQDDTLYPLQLVLREILIQNQAAYLDELGSFGMADQALLAESMKYAIIIIASLPVLILYPFIQRHFVKGVMIGSIKG
ncbi:putative aldouronate transport system permease protein [Pullulanibacillus pueri]|uniref:Sugar ABC transporter permease n=1 Tax=Pullulanibacillus pueri TaxID=1437324 RepID=A0A8J3EN90_9BACL|nr:carbohydrate ABC transporter permease [Pullulanibacillus pueri]MBM7683008.1 putative aldouronate transport system permease protein [Pullulanibacillus pueri]GGH85886.1 sugar ABC transporter permease [Pullulanibacillus pueri]